MSEEALYYTQLSDKKVKCLLCPHNCLIVEGKAGICNVRKNENGKLISLNYGQLSAVHLDPVEKKPLYHFFPGKNILSVGSIGCNLKCNFCQNSSISQVEKGKGVRVTVYKPETIVKYALKARNNIGVAYTYNEPVVWFEFMEETSEKIRKEGMKNVMVSNGYINPEPLKDLLPLTDAFNIDLKAFSDTFYRKQAKASLQPVLNTLRQIEKSGKHLEITNLIIPSLNDDMFDFEEMLKTISETVGKNTVLHLSRYFPSYKSKIPHTPKETLLKLYNKAKEYLNFVYLGNIISEEGNDTRCPVCNKIVIARTLRYTRFPGLKDGKCLFCNADIPVIQ